MNINEQILLFLGGFLVLCVIVFLLLREFFCWYWKINLRVSLLRENNRMLGLMLKNQGVDASLVDTPKASVDAKGTDPPPPIGLPWLR